MRLAYANGIEREARKRRGGEMISYDATAGVREFQRLDRAVEEAKLDVAIVGAYGRTDAGCPPICARRVSGSNYGNVKRYKVFRIRFP